MAHALGLLSSPDKVRRMRREALCVRTQVKVAFVVSMLFVLFSVANLGYDLADDGIEDRQVTNNIMVTLALISSIVAICLVRKQKNLTANIAYLQREDVQVQMLDATDSDQLTSVASAWEGKTGQTIEDLIWFFHTYTDVKFDGLTSVRFAIERGKIIMQAIYPAQTHVCELGTIQEVYNV